VRRFLPLLGALLAILGIARMAALVLHDPMLAFANQYDMVRTGACVGLYPDQPKIDAATPDAPRDRFRMGDPTTGACYLGTEVAFAAALVAARRLQGASGAFRALRPIGILKLALAGLAIVALVIAFFPHPSASLLHGATVLAVVADPVVTLWFQTLYAEFPILLGIYLVVGALVSALLRGALSAGTAILAGVGIVFAAYAKEQFFLLPLMLLAIAAPRLLPASRRAMLLLAALAVGAVAWHAVIPRPEAIAPANRADAYLGLILPASSDLPGTLAVLGLPPRCADLSGATWYLRRGEDLQAACPEALALPSTAFLRLAPAEPLTLARAAARAIPTTQNPLLGYLGLVADRQWAGLEAAPPWARSVLAEVGAIPSPAYLAAVLLALAAGLPALILYAASRKRGGDPRAQAFGAYMLMLAVIAAYAVGTTAFGDGLSETARHNLPGFLALAAMALAVPFGLAMLRTIGPGVRMAVGVATLGAVALALMATQWALGQPLAIGVLDAPGTMQVPREGFLIKGWALDPTGVAEVRVRVAGHEARIGREQLLPSPHLEPIYGSYPDAARGNFELAVPAAWLTAAEVRLRVEVANLSGVVTEIDRRRLKPAT
jgi:hypothetical protein